MGRPKGSKNKPRESTILAALSANPPHGQCQACRHYAPRQAGGVGWCHRLPPRGGWPVVTETDWCGEWEARP